MKKGKLVGKIFGIALLFVMIGAMLGGIGLASPSLDDSVHQLPVTSEMHVSFADQSAPLGVVGSTSSCTAKFSKGDTVVVDASPDPCLNVRSGPGTGYTSYKCESNGAVGVILDANPIPANGWCWVEVRYCDGIQGYSVQEGLKDKYITPSTKFSIGDTIRVTPSVGVKYRSEPPELNELGAVSQGTEGKILAGPKYGAVKDVSGCYWFWKVDYGGGRVGWSAEDYLEKVTPCPYSCWDRGALSGNELAALVRSHFPYPDCLGGTQTGESKRVTAYAVARAESTRPGESGANPSACGDIDNPAPGHMSIGLWQINTYWHTPPRGNYDRCKLFEPDYNANAAREISNNGNNWNPWSAWKNGNYEQYLTEARRHFYPKVTSLSVSQTSINLGDAVRIYYSVSDDVGLDRVELWRAVDVNGDGQPDWPSNPQDTKPASGQSASGYFNDSSHPSADTYWYGIHVVDNSGAPEAWNDERNSRTGGSPGVFGPKKVEVIKIQYTLTTSVSPSGSGSVDPSGGTFDAGTVVTLTANPASGWQFDHWSGTDNNAINPTTVTMNSNKSVTAYFTKIQYTLTTSVSPSGSGSVDPSGGTFDAGTVVTLTANPASGWQFDHWSGTDNNAINPTTVTMNSNKSVTAYFTKIQYTLTTSVSPSGSGSVDPSGGTFDAGTVVTLTANPASGWQFDHWSGTDNNAINPTTVTMNSNKSVTAYFTKIQYTLTTSVSPSGSGSVDPSGGTFDAGTVVTLTANPASGWQFDHWSGTDNNAINPTTVTMNSNKSVTAYFEEIPAEVTVVMVSPPSQEVTCGDSFSVNVTVDPKVAIAGVQFDLSFDSSLITAVSVEEGNLLNQNGASTYFSPGTIDNGAGTITGVAGTITASGETVSSPGTFAVINFTAKDIQGTSTLDLSNVIVGDINGDPMPIAVNDGNVTTSRTGDVNNDDHVNVLDMILIGQHWGETGSPGWILQDVKKDGVINVLDMIIIGQHWTG